jgi:CheY-like chemotaxis protein
MYCEKRKFPYTTAVDGLLAIDAYKAAANNKAPIDLILLDLQMPNCDGIEACQEIREFEREEGLRPAIIFISMLDRHQVLFKFLLTIL